MRISDWSSDVCSSDLATADALVARGVDRDRIAVTPNGLRQLPAPDERHVPAGPTVLAVGQLTARKRLDVLLEAAAALPDDVTIVLAGPDAGQGAELDRKEHKSELLSLMRISYAVFCLKTTTKQEIY